MTNLTCMIDSARWGPPWISQGFLWIYRRPTQPKWLVKESLGIHLWYRGKSARYSQIHRLQITNVLKYFAVLWWATNVLLEMEGRCCCCRWLWENLNHAFSFAAGQLAFLIETTVMEGGCFCPRGQLWWSKHKLTQSAQGSQLFHLLIHQNAEILKSYLPLLNVFNLLLIGFKWNYVGPRENPTDYFLWSPVQHCHLFQSEETGLIAVMRSSSGWSAGDTYQRRLAAGEMRQWPCNWPWLHIIDSSNCTTMRSAFWCRSGYNLFAPLNWLSGKLNCGALWVTGPTRFKGHTAHTASWWHPILS